jgi:nucleotidyltransferase substrate binding protein (TIGR01987 family)
MTIPLLHTDLDIRWQQRLSNFSRSKNMLCHISSVDVSTMDFLTIAGWIHIFDLTFELSWKTLRDYMVAQWLSDTLSFPREILSAGYTHGILQSPDIWLSMLANRNISTHEYDEATSLEIIKNIKNLYVQPISALYDTLQSRI